MGLLLMNEKISNKNSVLTNTPPTKTTTTSTLASAPRGSSNDVPSFVSQPSETDVLCGQDKTFSQHQGNKLYRSVIASWAEKYGHCTTKQSKMQMTTHICQMMKMVHRSRFLKPTAFSLEQEGCPSFRWTELTDQAARDKISHALRTSAAAARRRQEFRDKKIAYQEQQQSEDKQQPAHQQQPQHKQQQQLQQQQRQQQLQQNVGQPQPMLQRNEPWVTRPHFPHRSLQSFASLPEAPSNIWNADAMSTDLHNFEPLPVSGPVSFYNAADIVASASHLLTDNSEDEKVDSQFLVKKEQRGMRQLTEQQQTHKNESV